MAYLLITKKCMIDPCSALDITKILLSVKVKEITKKSSLRSTKRDVVLPKFKMSHVRISYSPNITQIGNFARDFFFFNIGFPPDASILQSKMK